MKKIIYTKDIIPGIIIDMRMFMIKIKLWEDKYIIIFTSYVPFIIIHYIFFQFDFITFYMVLQIIYTYGTAADID